MNPTERIIAVTEGREVDRVPTMSILTDMHPVHQVLGFPKVKETTLLMNRFSKFIINRLGKGRLGQAIVKGDIEKMFFKPLEAAVALGFDAAWGFFAPSFNTILDSKTIRDDWGSYNEIIDDGHGNLTYMYREPAITNREDYVNWPHFPDTDYWAQEAFKIFKKGVAKYGDKICICGETVSDLHDRIQTAMGFTNLTLNIRKDPDLIREFIARLEEFTMKTNMAMMDAGIKVILKGDDMSFKTGPQMNPKTFDAFWGPAYTRICKAVHDRGGKIFLHSCGDNTKLFDYFIKWGFDGGHAYETTSNVDIFNEKKIHGDRFTIIGGMGVDYLLTERSRPEEVVEKAKELIKHLAPGGRFILAPAHSHSDIDMSKERIMIETAKEFGKYPISL